LRRNKQKYFTWNFQPNYCGYVNPKEYNKGYDDTSALPKKIFKRNEGDNELKQSQSDTFPEMVQGHVFKPMKLNYDVQKMENDISTVTPLKINQSYAPKKIIKKNDIKPDFKNDTKSYKQSNFEQIEQSNIGGEKNVSQYRKNQIFKMEDLKKNQVYYYKFGNNHSSQIDKNINIIIKEI
jgi:hypothetical protein